MVCLDCFVWIFIIWGYNFDIFGIKNLKVVERSSNIFCFVGV